MFGASIICAIMVYGRSSPYLTDDTATTALSSPIGEEALANISGRSPTEMIAEIVFGAER